MATIPFWYDEPNAWDTCALGVFVLPGRARVDVSRTKPIDVRKAPGQYGATLIILGSDPATVTITLTLWTPEQWSAAVTILGAIELPNPKQQRKPQAYSIAHPVAQSRGINGVVVQTIAGPRVGSIVGTMEYTLSCLESLPPLKVQSVAPKLSIAGHTTPISNPTPPSIATPPKP